MVKKTKFNSQEILTTKRKAGNIIPEDPLKIYNSQVHFVRLKERKFFKAIF